MFLLIFLQIVLISSIIIKSILHARLGARNNINFYVLGGVSLKTFWFFTEPVQEDDERLKRICNNLQSGNIILALIVVVLNILI